MLLHDSGEDDPGRFFIFGTQRNLDMLANNRHWFTDGTFKVAPHLFYHTCYPRAKWKMLVALACVPVQDVVTAFESLVEDIPDELMPLIVYFEDTWIGRHGPFMIELFKDFLERITRSKRGIIIIFR